MELTRELARALALGGGVLGGGGGGRISEGLRLLELALEAGRPRLVALSELQPDDLLVTVSAVGAPAATEQDVRASDYVDALQLLLRTAGVEAAGLISSENGGASSANGFIQSAFTGLPVVDAPCDGRAHPTGVMGSMGLHRRDGYVSRQAAVGGGSGRRVRLYAEGALESVDQVVRQAAAAAGGLVAVARNPVEAAYVREHGAPGALALAIELGRLVLTYQHRGGEAVVEALLAHLGEGQVLARGAVEEYQLRTENAYDIGRLRIGQAVAIFWNEFMAVDVGAERRATFPDLIFAVDRRSGLPVTTAELGMGTEVVLAAVPQHRVPVGAGARDVEALAAAERVLGIRLRPGAPGIAADAV